MAAEDKRGRLIVALDFRDAAAAGEMVARLGDAVTFYKIGMELVYGGDGLALASRLIAQGKRVFIDLKLHDIPNTVERATRQIARLGATFLTVHGYPQTMRAAKAGAEGSSLKILGVTVLTSYDDADLAEAGYAGNVRDVVARRARQAREAGIDGLILSPEELPSDARRGRPGFSSCQPRYPAGRRGQRGPKARHDAGASDCRRRGLSRRRASRHKRA